MRQCIQAGTPKCLDSDSSKEDTQLQDMEKNKQDALVKTLSTSFKPQTFNSCDNMESVMKTFIKDYYQAHPYNNRFLGGPLMMEDMAVSSPRTTSAAVGESAK